MKEVLIEILDYYKHKIEVGKCTQEEMRTAFRVISDDVVCDATIKDLAEFYGQSESNIRNIASRKMVKKPRREVLYDFKSFASAVPKKWRSNKR